MPASSFSTPSSAKASTTIAQVERPRRRAYPLLLWPSHLAVTSVKQQLGQRNRARDGSPLCVQLHCATHFQVKSPCDHTYYYLRKLLAPSNPSRIVRPVKASSCTAMLSRLCIVQHHPHSAAEGTPENGLPANRDGSVKEKSWANKATNNHTEQQSDELRSSP